MATQKVALISHDSPNCNLKPLPCGVLLCQIHPGLVLSVEESNKPHGLGLNCCPSPQCKGISIICSITETQNFPQKNPLCTTEETITQSSLLYSPKCHNTKPYPVFQEGGHYSTMFCSKCYHITLERTASVTTGTTLPINSPRALAFDFLDFLFLS